MGRRTPSAGGGSPQVIPATVTLLAPAAGTPSAGPSLGNGSDTVRVAYLAPELVLDHDAQILSITLLLQGPTTPAPGVTIRAVLYATGPGERLLRSSPISVDDIPDDALTEVICPCGLQTAPEASYLVGWEISGVITDGITIGTVTGSNVPWIATAEVAPGSWTPVTAATRGWSKVVGT